MRSPIETGKVPSWTLFSNIGLIGCSIPSLEAKRPKIAARDVFLKKDDRVYDYAVSKKSKQALGKWIAVSRHVAVHVAWSSRC